MSVTLEDIKQVDRNLPYADFRKAFIADPVKVMREAAKLEMTLQQYANHVSSETIMTEKRSILSKLGQDEGLYTRSSTISKASLVEEYFESPHRIAMLQSILTSAFYNQRAQITFEADSPIGSPTYPFSTAQTPSPVASGLRLNPGELVANSNEIGSDSYKPFRWDYDKDDDDKNLKRHNVAPGATIPATTLGVRKGTIQMAKWGNRFVLPYETLTSDNMRVDKLASMMRLEGMTEESRMYIELVKILSKGDGTPNSAATLVQQSAVGGSTNNGLEFAAFLNAIDEILDPPFMVTHVLMRKTEFRALRTAISALSGETALMQLNQVGLAPSFSNMENHIEGTLRYGRVPDEALDTNHILFLDARAAVEYVSRSGMTIRQQADNIANESREVVVSDTYLWAKLAIEACKELDTDN